MGNKTSALMLAAGVFCALPAPIRGQDAARITEVPFTQVRIQDGFWSPHIETNRTVSSPQRSGSARETGVSITSPLPEG